MKTLGHSIALLTTGAIAGIVFVFACGHDAPHADAAACDCPAAEPPLTAARYTVVDTRATIAAGDTGFHEAVCPDGTLFVAGSCTTADLNPARFPTLSQSGFYGGTAGDAGRAWGCVFKNEDAVPVEIKASVICLKPAP